MPPASDRSPSALSSPTSGRRILSRITSPFTSKPRNISDFAVEPDDPHKQHSPGDIVTGSVKLRVTKPIRVTHVVACLHGFVQVFKNPGSPGEGPRVNGGHPGTGRGKRSGEYFGNGFATLFEDEVVLCGDGRLAEGSYQFNFEFAFPDRDLPSSIDFERGTISYLITATITRPTGISPTITCDRKVYFVERIDISPLYPPKARTITLEPISKRSRAKTQARKLVDHSERKSRKADSAQQSIGAPRQSQTSSASSTHTDNATPASPAPSEISFDSALSSQGRASQPGSRKQSSPSASDAGKFSKPSLAGKVIKATVESQAGGCLRGDSIPVKVNIDHTKHVKSLYGVIVTLYRQARVDMHPAIPLGSTEKGKDAKIEDYYPKSITGLGGLSLSGTGSSHIFRKDLSQVMVPLMIDPQTLTAEIHTKVRVPDEAFPTISTVPGAMISFKYYVEVILDIQGKLAGQDRNMSNLSGQAGALGHFMNMEGSDLDRSAFMPFGSTIVDMAPVKRDKSVVTCTFEVVVGTRDSERRKGKRKMIEAASESVPPPKETQQEAPQQMQVAYQGMDWYEPDVYHDPQWYQQQHSYYYPQDYAAPGQHQSVYQDQSYEQPPPIPLPRLPDESEMTEKERVQQAEARLLPSHPPAIDGESAEAGFTEATAPYLPEESGNSSRPGVLSAAPEYGLADAASCSAVVATYTAGRQDDLTPEASRAPEYQLPPNAPSAHNAAYSSGGQQEMQRQQLEAGSSAPPNDEDGVVESSRVRGEGPPATTLDEAGEPPQDIYDSHAEAAGSSGLPRYER